jgi:hypothetical protein
VLAAATAAGLTACASGTATVGSSSVLPSSSPTVSVNPGGPIISPSPVPSGGSGSSNPTTGATGTPARGIPATGYSTVGTVLTVYYTAGVCDKYGVTADQSQPGRVLVQIVVTRHAPTGQMCPMIVSQQHSSVDLGRPLDGRQVMDAGNGKVLPQEHTIPSAKVTHGPVGQS